MTNDFKARKNGYRQPQRSPEEYKQFKKEEKEAVYQLVDSAVALELGYAELSSRSESFSRKDMSFQAVCVGYMLCKKYGVDTKNFAVDRVPAEWKDKEPNDVRAELSKVRTAMSDIHSRISDELYRQQQERTADRAR